MEESDELGLSGMWIGRGRYDLIIVTAEEEEVVDDSSKTLFVSELRDFLEEDFTGLVVEVAEGVVKDRFLVEDALGVDIG